MPKKPTPYTAECGIRLRRAREALGFEKIRHFATERGLNEDRYRAWERGDNEIPAWFILELRLVYGLTHDFIYAGDPSGLPIRLAQAMGYAVSLPDDTKSSPKKRA